MVSVLLMQTKERQHPARTQHTDNGVQIAASLSCLSSSSTAQSFGFSEFPHMLRPVFTLLWSLLGFLQCPECFVSLQKELPPAPF